MLQLQQWGNVSYAIIMRESIKIGIKHAGTYA